MIRHLLYNCCAFSHSDVWIQNIEKLNSYSNAFNGRKIIIVKEGPGIIPFDDVCAKFKLPDAEFVRIENNKWDWELAGFFENLKKLESLSHDEAIFYAHTKGVRYNPRGLNASRLKYVQKWRNVMYKECLQDTDKIESILKNYSCCGCFRNNLLKKYSRIVIPYRCGWIFAGTFWWVRSDKLFSRNWMYVGKKKDNNKMLVENYLGFLFPFSESYCIFGDEWKSLYSSKQLYNLDV